MRMPTPHQIAWTLLRADKSDDAEQELTERLCQLFPHLSKARKLAQGFARMFRERLPDRLNEWLRSAMRSKLKEFIQVRNLYSNSFIFLI